jgi:hypothetical protein
MKSRYRARRQRAERSRQIVEERMEAALEQSKQQVKKLTPEPVQPPAPAPLRENPFARILRKLREDNARTQ